MVRGGLFLNKAGKLYLKGIGIDIFEKKRMKAALLKKNSGIFLKRVFDHTELIGFSRHSRQYLHFSIAFAAKEAVLKAFGMGWNAYANFCDIRVKMKDNKMKITLAGKTKIMAKKKGVRKIACDYSVSPRHVVVVVALVA